MECYRAFMLRASITCERLTAQCSLIPRSINFLGLSKLLNSLDSKRSPKTLVYICSVPEFEQGEFRCGYNEDTHGRHQGLRLTALEDRSQVEKGPCVGLWVETLERH